MAIDHQMQICEDFINMRIAMYDGLGKYLLLFTYNVNMFFCRLVGDAFYQMRHFF